MAHCWEMIDLGKEFSVKNVMLEDADAKLLRNNENDVLQICSRHKEECVFVRIPIPEESKLSQYIAVDLDITNEETKSIVVETQRYDYS
uniref:hypothetical protein n=1 Tax=Phocaeicola dorei TaxID=357276 RepID=UPI004025AA8B